MKTGSVPPFFFRLRKMLLPALCFVLFCGCLLSVPYVASAIPEELGVLLTGSPLPDPPIPALRSESRAGAPEESGSVSGEGAESIGGGESEWSELSEESELSSAPEPPEGAISVIARNYCRYDDPADASLLVNDHTTYGVRPEDYAERPFPIEGVDLSVPTVLIVHTHGTESYLPAGTDFYTEDEDFRSEDPAETVVAVGDAVAEVLLAGGVRVIHDRTMYDAEDYNTAYASSAKAVRRWLALYPSIRYVLDVHRDSIAAPDGTYAKTLTEIGGTRTAQVMLVVGSDADGANSYDWKRNFTLAVFLQQALNERFPTLARPLNLRTWAFNQTVSPGSLLLEVGSCTNTVEEAVEAGRMFAQSYAEVIREHANIS